MMHYAGEYVRSPIHGLGEVVVTGPNPVVHFMDGPEMRVPGDMLTVVPRETYEAEVENRRRIERWLDWRLYGRLERDVPPLPRPRLDLAAAMAAMPLPLSQRPGLLVDDPGLCFVLADLGAGGRDGHPLPVAPRPVRVVARRRVNYADVAGSW